MSRSKIYGSSMMMHENYWIVVRRSLWHEISIDELREALVNHESASAPSRLRGRSRSRVRDWMCWSTTLLWSLWRTTWWLFVRKCGLFDQTVRRSDLYSGVRSYDSSWSDCWKILCQAWLYDVYGWRTLFDTRKWLETQLVLESGPRFASNECTTHICTARATKLCDARSVYCFLPPSDTQKLSSIKDEIFRIKI